MSSEATVLALAEPMVASRAIAHGLSEPAKDINADFARDPLACLDQLFVCLHRLVNHGSILNIFCERLVEHVAHDVVAIPSRTGVILL